MNMSDYGWNKYFQDEWDKKETKGMRKGRIIADYGQKLRVITEEGEICMDRPCHFHEKYGQLVVGDWIAIKNTEVIEFVLPRRTKFSRAAAGIEVKEQIIASNVDTVFIIQSLNRDFNVRRLERYLIASWESGAIPVVVLTKADCCENIADKISIVNNAAPGVEVHVVSAVTGEGINEIRRYLENGKTIALLGSSGVGKSTLVNTLAGKDILKTQSVREDDSRGRHTTTHREIVNLDEGGMILDTPGMRSLSLWEANTGMETVFGDIEKLTESCRFYDCHHGNEPGCSVREALECGSLEISRWESWLKLQKEMAHLEAKKEGKEKLMEKKWGKQIAKFQKEIQKGRLR